MSSRRVLVSIFAVLSAAMLMHLKPNPIGFYNNKWFQFYVLR